MHINVLQNAKRNLFFGTVNKFTVLICPFLERTIIQTVLGAEYLGLGSLYSSILSVLSLTELGFHSAMVYNMYKPAAEGNTQKINALLNYYKQVYRRIGLAVTGFGLVLVPALPHLINGTYPSDINLTALYLLYLANSALSYFMFSYMMAIVVVNQRDDIQSSINSVIRVLLLLAQSIALFTTENYYFFALLMIFFTVLNNLFVAWRVHKVFPQYRAAGKLGDGEKSGIKKLVAGTFVQQTCSVTRNSLDSVYISAFLGLTLTAIYNNYYLIMKGVISFLSVISSAFSGGVGNHVAIKTKDENYTELQRLNFAYMWISGFCTACLICLYQPFMRLWMGKDMMLPFSSVILFGLYFYALKLGDMLSLYSSANGLWWQHRYRAVCETVMNVTLNFVLGKVFGVNGIIAATMISLLLCNFIWGTIIIFKAYFTADKCKAYFKFQIKQTLVMAVTCLLAFAVCSGIVVKNQIAVLGIRAAICFTTATIVYTLFYRKTKEFIYIKERFFKKGSKR